MKLETVDVAYIKNKDTEDLHKMGSIKKEFSCGTKREKGFLLGEVKNSTRDVYSVQHGGKNFFSMPKEKSFFETVQKRMKGK